MISWDGYLKRNVRQRWSQRIMYNRRWEGMKLVQFVCINSCGCSTKMGRGGWGWWGRSNYIRCYVQWFRLQCTSERISACIKFSVECSLIGSWPLDMWTELAISRKHWRHSLEFPDCTSNVPSKCYQDPTLLPCTCVLGGAYANGAILHCSQLK